MTTIDLVLRILSTAAALVIGIAASILAYQQFKISKAKLRFDLYEKRLALFKLTREFVTEINFNTTHKKMGATNELRLAFDRDTSERYFLFSKDVIGYFDELLENAYELGCLHASFSDLSETEIHRMKEIYFWFLPQGKEMTKRFEKDLTIKTL